MEYKLLNFVQLLPQEISETIFMNLACVDLLNAMLVHSSWNYLIGASKTITANIKLGLSTTKIKQSDIEILKESHRQYQHLELNLFGPKSEDLISIINLRDWKSFQLRCKLTRNIGERLLETLLVRCSKINNLQLHFDWLELTGKILKACQKLKTLKLQGCLESDDIFNDQDIHLQVLHLNIWRSYNKPPIENPQLFNRFLKCQTASLTALSINFGNYGPFLDEDTLYIILTMPKLTHLTLNIDSPFLHPNQPLEHLPDNHSVVELMLLLNFNNIIQGGPNNVTKNFMKKFRNVKTLRLKELHRNVFQFVEKYFNATLEKVIIEDTVYMSSDSSHVNAFPNLHSVKFFRAINPQFERHLKNVPKDELGNFSKCLLNEIQNHSNDERTFRSAALYPTLTIMASDLQ